MQQTFTQKYTIAQLFEDIPEGTEYNWKGWPLHATLVDVFAIDWDVPTMVEKLTELLAEYEPVESTVGEDELFGPQKEVRVALIEKTPGLVRLHNDLMNVLEPGNLKLNNSQFAREGFVPHSTVQKHARLNKGDKVKFTAIAIIDLFPNKDPYKRKILKTINIGTARAIK